VFDHIFSNEVPFLCYVIIAYLVYFRASLLRVGNADDFQFFLHHQNAINLSELLILAYKVQGDTPVQIVLGASVVT
jgi:hypothetical protein